MMLHFGFTLTKLFSPKKHEQKAPAKKVAVSPSHSCSPAEAPAPLPVISVWKPGRVNLNHSWLDSEVRQHWTDIPCVLVTQAAGETGGVREAKDRRGAEGLLHRQQNETGQVNSGTGKVFRC